MGPLRRYDIAGDVVFTTHVTYVIQNILVHNADLLMTEFTRLSEETSFTLIAYVILPDHFHAISRSAGMSMSDVFRLIKSRFSGALRSRYNERSGKIWQRRFWDHIIRNEADMRRHLDYIHFNPVKHGLVHRPFHWNLSSIHLSVYAGSYDMDWSVIDQEEIDGNYGE